MVEHRLAGQREAQSQSGLLTKACKRLKEISPDLIRDSDARVVNLSNHFLLVCACCNVQCSPVRHRFDRIIH